MPAGGQSFTARYKLRFGQCDPAGIAFFPRLIEMMTWLVEDWFDQGLGMDFRTIHVETDLGIPTVGLSVDFLGPARLGDVLVYHLSVTDVGRSSLTLAMTAEHESGKMVLRARNTIVLCDISGEEPRPIPIEGRLRQHVDAFRAADAQAS